MNPENVSSAWFDALMSTDLAEHWIHEGFIAFDTETTGVEVDSARIVTAAAVVFEGSTPLYTRSWLIKVDGQGQTEALVEIRDFLADSGMPIVCFNSGFDIPLFNANLARLELDLLPTDQVLCSYVIDKQCNKYVKGKAQRRLKPTADRYGIELSEQDWHGAEADARVAGQIFLAELAAYPELSEFSITGLSATVDLWREQQDREFQEWLARQPARS